MYDLFISIARAIQSLPTFAIIILLVVITIAKLILAIRQLYAQEASPSGFAMGSVITNWIACVAVAIYSITVFITGYIIISLLALIASVVFGALSKSVKIPALGAILVVLCFFSGILFGVIGDRFIIDISFVGELILDFILGAIAVKLSDKAPNYDQITEQRITEKLIGINKDFYRLRYAHQPGFNDNERLIFSSCSYADTAYDNNMAAYKRVWLAGTVLWFLIRKTIGEMSNYTEQIRDDGNGKFSFSYEYDHDEDMNIFWGRQFISNSDTVYENPVLGILDAVMRREGEEDELYVRNAARIKMGTRPSSDYTDEYIEKRNSDIRNEEYVKSVLSDLKEFFITGIDLRYLKSDQSKIAYMKALPIKERYIFLYGVVCLCEDNVSLFTDSHSIISRIKQLDSTLDTQESNVFWATFFADLDMIIEKLGETTPETFITILNSWNKYRPAFREAINILR